MKLSPGMIRQFEAEQQHYGTEIALHNVLWEVAAELLHDLGVNRIRTSYAKDARPPRARVLEG